MGNRRWQPLTDRELSVITLEDIDIRSTGVDLAFLNQHLAEVGLCICESRKLEKPGTNVAGEAGELISDPLQWQAEIHASGWGGPNMKGATRFWNTVEALSGMDIEGVNGFPDFSEIIIRLQGNIGLRLYTVAPDYAGGPAPHIRYEFVEVGNG